jgi:hypothetical protein
MKGRVEHRCPFWPGFLVPKTQKAPAKKAAAKKTPAAKKAVAKKIQKKVVAKAAKPSAAKKAAKGGLPMKTAMSAPAAPQPKAASLSPGSPAMMQRMTDSLRKMGDSSARASLGYVASIVSA